MVAGAQIDSSTMILREEPVVCVARDPRDVHTIGMLALGGLVLTGAFSVSVLLNLWQFWRVPDRIVVDRTSGRVIEINDRQYGMTDAV